jgi:hypothetical protein
MMFFGSVRAVKSRAVFDTVHADKPLIGRRPCRISASAALIIAQALEFTANGHGLVDGAI